MAIYTIPYEQINEEQKRLKVLDSYGILDTLPEKEYDDIADLASYICEAQVSIIALMDHKRNWYKSVKGDINFHEKEMLREHSFCRITIQKNDLYEIPDMLKDQTFKDNPVVVDEPWVRYYAGYPLINSQGYKLGTLCIVDTVPKKLNQLQRDALRTLANQVMVNFELRKKTLELEKQKQSLLHSNTKLEQFAQVVSHDLKEPLRNTRSLFELNKIDPAGHAVYKEKIEVSLDRMESLINGILAFARSDDKEIKKENVDTYHLVKTLGSMYNGSAKIEIDKKLPTITTEKVLLEQIFQNLISNAVKYNDKSVAEVKITHTWEEGVVIFSVRDNGPGIPANQYDNIFKPFTRLVNKEDIEGTGIGLATTKKILNEKKGKIWVRTNTDESGVTFQFSWPV